VSHEQVISDPSRVLTRGRAPNHGDRMSFPRLHLKVDTALRIGAESVRGHGVERATPPIRRSADVGVVRLNACDGPIILDSNEERAAVCVEKSSKSATPAPAPTPSL
jgi:hypothetical protein